MEDEYYAKAVVYEEGVTMAVEEKVGASTAHHTRHQLETSMEK